MVRRSKISFMRAPARRKLDAMLASGATIDATHKEAKDMGEDVSRSSIARRAKLIAKEGKLMREMRMLCGALMSQMEGEGLTPEDSVRFLGSLLAVRLQQHLLQPEENPLNSAVLGEMTRAVRTLGKVFAENPPAKNQGEQAPADPLVLEMLATIRKYGAEGAESEAPQGDGHDEN